MALLQARETAMRYFRPVLADHDLTEQQWRVLRALTVVKDPLDAGELAERTLLLPPSLSRILATLDERGLLERSPDRLDQRRTLVVASAAGRRQVAEIAPESERRYAQIETAFGTERLHKLVDLLNDFSEAVATTCPD